MGISNIASNLRPGICTFATRPTTPYEGQVIYETDTNRTLVWDNAAWVDPSTGKTGRAGLVKIVPASATNATVESNGDVTIGTAVSSITITDCFSEDFKNYRMLIRTYSNSSADERLDIQLRSGSTTAITNYYTAWLYANYSTSASGVAAGSNVSAIRYVATAIGTDGMSGVLDILAPYDSRPTRFNGSTSRTDLSGTVNGYHSASTSYSSCVLTVAAGTVTTGLIQIYGYN